MSTTSDHDRAGRDALGVAGTRIEILRLALSSEEITARDVMTSLGITRNAVGKQVSPLVDAGLLIERRAYTSRGSGRQTYWRADRDRILDAFRSLITHTFGTNPFN
ncbi:ArsR/SmtB family transcription factor [Leifsonia sp. McL0607]|uniref:ArsR/SmtB family transcription factor n=1 Tax=Leifsonia sp. McL0607 TaxID=3415672 RepID=UPI003CF55AA9